MQVIVGPNGDVRYVYGETIDLKLLGAMSVQRASHVEPDGDNGWLVDLAPVQGPILGPFPLRSQAIEVERDWLDGNWLLPLGSS